MNKKTSKNQSVNINNSKGNSGAMVDEKDELVSVLVVRDKLAQLLECRLRVAW